MKWWQTSWNPVVGCTPVSPGCKNCYAKALHDQRHVAHILQKEVWDCYAQPFETVQLMEKRLERPLHWRKPRRVFVNSMSDLFHEDVPFEFLDRVFAVMALAQQHTFMILTKRPERMREYVMGVQGEPIDTPRDFAIFDAWRAVHGDHYGQRLWPLPNLWLGVTAENQEQADARIPVLLEAPAAKRFVSIEPMLGPVDLTAFFGGDNGGFVCPNCGVWEATERYCATCDTDIWDVEGYVKPSLDWVICGGESGRNARPMHPDWARSLRDQCEAAGVPFFHKQNGEWVLCPGLDVACSECEYDAKRTKGPGTFSHEYNMCRVGSRRAGRLLDGREHNEIPSGGAS